MEESVWEKTNRMENRTTREATEREGEREENSGWKWQSSQHIVEKY